MKRTLAWAFLPLLLATGCATNPDDNFLVQKLDDESKSAALARQGIEEYNVLLVRRADYARLGEVREYFAVALRYDPQNVEAAQYLDLVNEFKNARLRENLRVANRSLAKQKRSEDEDFALLNAVQSANRLDPGNPDVARLMRETSPARAALVATYLARSKAATARIQAGTPLATREALSVEAFANAAKALQVDPQSQDARARRDALSGELASLAARHAAAARALTADRKFEQARDEIAALAQLNRKLDGRFDAQVKAARYALAYRWAATLFAQKDYGQAETRADTALSVDRTQEAAALKRKIADSRAEADQAASFDAGLQEIDRLIAKEDLVGAKRRIDSLARATKDGAKLDALDGRREALMSLLQKVYDKGVAAYRDEKFKDAIEYLQTVVLVDVGYEQAPDYLEKARDKQKLLDQY